MLIDTDFCWLDNPEWTRPATPEEVDEYMCDYMVTDKAPEEVKKAFYEFVKPIYSSVTGRRLIK